MSKRPLIWLAWVGVLTLAAWLRLQNLTERPIHADEATGARIAANRIEQASYVFNPQHFHGPWLSISTAPIAQLRNETSWQSLSVLTLRSGTLLAGLLLTLTPLLWSRTLGSYPALIAGSLLATSPLLVYYSQMYIHESWLCLFGMLALAAVYQLWQRPTLAKGLIAGITLGLMFATKETVAISVLAWCITLILCSIPLKLGRDPNEFKLHAYIKPTLGLIAAYLLIAAYFYTNGFRQPSGLLDAFKTYFVYETTPGHEKPFAYYLHLLVWPKHLIGMWWTEALVAALALTSGLAAYQFQQRTRTIIFLALAGIAHCLIYSCIGYKTPWLMLLPWAHFCLLSGAAFCDYDRLKKPLQIGLTLLLIATLAFQTKQSLSASGRLASDARNPYSYVPTTKDPARIATWLEQLEAQSNQTTLNPIAVVGSDYWPLPWYLRSVDPIGYWPQPVDSLKELTVVLATTEQEAQCDALLLATHTKFPRSLRTNVSVTLYLRNDIWEQWLQKTSE